MSNDKEFQRTDAATGNERRPTVDRRKVGDDRACWRHEPADSCKVKQDRAAREKT